MKLQTVKALWKLGFKHLRVMSNDLMDIIF